ncbi:fibrillarin-like rRNA/tRNA 2'-O-methyltransferase [Candidatus Aerophobetes bacterium]|uniref:rRNA 2'-O-methyltransferase fibrillarin n=1 Tax=Aerophobetes bacterium TaxID=2030807 RepID=A0A662D8S2_UNCAE|nr:MAG: fibrillarin-like rRNA/tRNA 2'-O-methyltransferase [Candidatus Aerophobetes bacterium]
MKEVFPGVWKRGEKLFTENLVPGEKIFTKTVVKYRGREYREWDPYRSKPAAAILKGLKVLPLSKGAKILYLGIANGTTASFFSDIIGREGIIYGVEISERSLRDLNLVVERRGNIVPVLADARKPESYSWIEPVDVVYEDVATNDQSEILIRNCKVFLKKNGFAMIAIKARSIDVVKDPKEIYKEEVKKLSKYFKILDKRELDPYEKDHLFLVMKRIF